MSAEKVESEPTLSAISASSKYSGRMPAISTPLPWARSAFSSGICTVPKGSVTVVPSTSAGRKFIGGEPMKPATNRLPGFS